MLMWLRNDNNVARVKLKSIETSISQWYILNQYKAFYTDFTNAQAFFVSACEQVTSEDIKLVN